MLRRKYRIRLKILVNDPHDVRKRSQSVGNHMIWTHMQSLATQFEVLNSVLQSVLLVDITGKRSAGPLENPRGLSRIVQYAWGIPVALMGRIDIIFNPFGISTVL